MNHNLTGDVGDPLGTSPVELLVDRLQLPLLLELADGKVAPPIGGTDHGRVHKLQDGRSPKT